MARRQSICAILLLLSFNEVFIEGFSIAGARSRVHATTASENRLTSANQPSPLFSRRTEAENDKPSRLSKLSMFRPSTIIQKVQRKRLSGKVMSAAAMLWIASATVHTPPSSAASASAAAIPIHEKILSSSPTLDKMVDKYVKDHMFDDDSFDPIESAYREAYADATSGSHMNSIRDTVSGILGQEKKVLVGESSGWSIGTFLSSSLKFFQKMGVSESAAVLILVGIFGVGGPGLFLVGAAAVGALSKRNLNKTFKERYGDSYSVDATMKPEDQIEAPDDDEDDDDDDDDDSED